MRQTVDAKQTRRAVAAACMLFALVAASCAADSDAKRENALGVPLLLTVQDSLNVPKGDRVDWRRFTAMERAEATLLLRVGDPFAGGHNLQGVVTIFTEDAETVATTPITPNQMKLTLQWPATSNTLYYLKVAASSGSAPYKLELTYEAADPCAAVSCAQHETCVQGRCIASDQCDPPCEGDQSCVDGACISDATDTAVPPCGGKCGRGEICNKRRDVCVKNPCHGKRCRRGEVCRSGKCKKRDTSPSTSSSKRGNACEPACGAGETCVKGECKLGNLSAKVVQSVARGGDKTTITLSRGTSHKVKPGMKGKVSGVGGFTITGCTPYRCTAVLNAPISKLGSKSRATIYR